MRLQQTLEGRLPGPGSVPAQLSVAGAYMTTLPHDGPGADLSMDPMAEGDREACLGINMELVTELQRLMGCRWADLRHKKCFKKKVLFSELTSISIAFLAVSLCPSH